MNKKMVLAALSIVALAGTMAYAGAAPTTGVPGSVHDMTKYGASLGTGDPESSQGRVCAYCHTPHHAITAGNDYLPLWSHALPTVTTFTPYKSATIDATIDSTTMMVGPSMLCMSCHDGSVAVDTHYAFVGTKYMTDADDSFPDGATNSPTIVKGSSLGNDHPIGFVYEDVAVGPATGDDPPLAAHTQGKDEWVRNKDAVYINSNLKIKDRLYYSGATAKGIMTCATCHDVHNKKNKDEVGATNYLLLATNNGSALCLSCHIK